MTQKHTYMAIITQKHHLFFKIIIIMEKLTKEQWLDLIHDKLKDVFPSSKLTSLHTNAIKKQSFPGVNIVRQIFKEMGYKLIIDRIKKSN